jgi:ankyrin repeat protein
MKNRTLLPNGANLLLDAVQKNKIPYIFYLVTSEFIDPNVFDNQGNSALIIALKNGYTQAAKILIQNGANINVVDSNGWTPLAWAAREGYTELASLMVTKGAIVDQVIETIQMTAFTIAIQNKHIKIAKIHAPHGVDVNLPNNIDWTPLAYAIDNKRLDMVQFLIEQGAEINRIFDGWSPLMFAIASKCEEIALFLIGSGADVNLVTEGDKTALNEAIKIDNENIILSLFKAGARVTFSPINRGNLMGGNEYLDKKSSEIAYKGQYVDLAPDGATFLKENMTLLDC